MSKHISEYAEDKLGDCFTHVCEYSNQYIGNGVREVKYYCLPGKHMHWFSLATFGMVSLAAVAASGILLADDSRWRRRYFIDSTGEYLSDDLTKANNILSERKAAEEQRAREEAAKKKEAKEKAAEREAIEKETREREVREREARDMAAREREAREREIREREIREKEAREREIREREAQEIETRERAAREHEARALALLERYTQEQAQIEQTEDLLVQNALLDSFNTAREEADLLEAIRLSLEDLRVLAENLHLQGREHLNDGLEIINDGDADTDDREEANVHFNNALERFQQAMRVQVLDDIRSSLEELIAACRRNNNIDTVNQCIDTLGTYFQGTQQHHDLANITQDAVNTTHRYDTDITIQQTAFVDS